MSAFGENVRKYRKQKDLTLKQLADILGIKFQSVEKWEKGETMPKGPTLSRLAEALGITPNDLYYSPNESAGIVEAGDKVIVDRALWEAKERELEYLRTIFTLTKQSPNQQQSIENLKNKKLPATLLRIFIRCHPLHQFSG